MCLEPLAPQTNPVPVSRETRTWRPVSHQTKPFTLFHVKQHARSTRTADLPKAAVSDCPTETPSPPAASLSLPIDRHSGPDSLGTKPNPHSSQPSKSPSRTSHSRPRPSSPEPVRSATCAPPPAETPPSADVIRST